MMVAVVISIFYDSLGCSRDDAAGKVREPIHPKPQILGAREAQQPFEPQELIRTLRGGVGGLNADNKDLIRPI